MLIMHPPYKDQAAAQKTRIKDETATKDIGTQINQTSSKNKAIKQNKTDPGSDNTDNKRGQKSIEQEILSMVGRYEFLFPSKEVNNDARNDKANCGKKAVRIKIETSQRE